MQRGYRPGQQQCQRTQGPEPGPAVRSQPRHDQHQGQAVQDAEVNKALRVHGVGACAHQQGRQRHLCPAPPKARPALSLLHRHGLPQACAEHKQAHDGTALPGPKRIVVKIGLEVAEVVQVKAEMKQGHPDDGHAAQGVQG